MEGEVNSRKGCLSVLKWEREGKGDREIEDAGEREETIKEDSHQEDRRDKVKNRQRCWP